MSGFHPPATPHPDRRRALPRLLLLLVVTSVVLSSLALAGVLPAARVATAAALEVGGDAHPLGRLLAPPPARSVVRAADGSVLAVLHGDQDRTVVPLSAVPMTVRDAVLADRGRPLLRPRRPRPARHRPGGGRRPGQRPHPPGRQRPHPAVRQERGHRRPPQPAPQAGRGDGRHRAAAAPEQGPDPGRLPQPGLLRRRGLWDRRRRPALLLPASRAPDPGPGGRPGRHHRQPRAVPADRRPRPPGPAATRSWTGWRRSASPARPGSRRPSGSRCGPGCTARRSTSPISSTTSPGPCCDDHALDRALGPAGIGGPPAGGVRGRPAGLPPPFRPTTSTWPSRRSRGRLAGAGLGGALVSLDPASGAVVAMVGGRDFASSKVNLATGQGGGGFPPGSSFKVFYLVAALEKGIPVSTSFDTASPITVTAPACPAGYSVHNAEPASPGRHRTGPGHRRVRQHLLRPADGQGRDRQRDPGGQAHGDQPRRCATTAPWSSAPRT